jgi:pyruvate dehydrogenase E1 component alpha subunit
MIKESDLSDIEAEVKKIVDDSVEFAKQSPVPQPDDLYNDIYSEEYPDARRRDPWR